MSEPRFFLFLLEIDRYIAQSAHDQPCSHCAGRLNWGNFYRSGYGLPAGSDESLRIRFSLCCREDNCRKRLTPPSLRYLRGVSYVTIVVVLLSAIQHGLSTSRAKTLKKELKVSRSTIARWLIWWRQDFATSSFWRAGRGRFGPTLDETCLPTAILKSFHNSHTNDEAAAVGVLRFLAFYCPN